MECMYLKSLRHLDGSTASDLKGHSCNFYTLECVYRSWGVTTEVKKKPFIDPEEAMCNLINCLQLCNPVAKLHCG